MAVRRFDVRCSEDVGKRHPNNYLVKVLTIEVPAGFVENTRRGNKQKHGNTVCMLTQGIRVYECTSIYDSCAPYSRNTVGVFSCKKHLLQGKRKRKISIAFQRVVYIKSRLHSRIASRSFRPGRIKVSLPEAHTYILRTSNMNDHESLILLLCFDCAPS